jgi:hypothetical protein
MRRLDHRTPLPRRLLLIALLALSVCARADAARADTGTITVNSVAGDRTTATFSLTKTTCALTYYCGWFAVASRVPARQSCSTTSPVWVGPIIDGRFTVTETAEFYAFASDSPHRLCLYVYENFGYTLITELVYAHPAPAAASPTPVPTPPATSPPVVPAPSATPIPPAGDAIITTRIPRWIGRRDTSSAKLTLFGAEVPSTIDVDRFAALVRAAARRWEISTGGLSWRTFRFARPDGRNGIGFSSRLDADTLGITHTWTARVYRTRRSCNWAGGITRCRKVRRYIGRRVVERDVALNRRVRWHQGPGYPRPDAFDLETVIIHELGHWAGNKHSEACEASPMVPDLDLGDWWRTPTDYRYSGCGRLASAARARRPGALRHTSTVVDLQLPPHVPDRAADAHANTVWARRIAASDAATAGSR